MNQQPNPDELKACPFCGEKPLPDRTVPHKNGCYLFYTETNVVWEDFVNEWNTRTPDLATKPIDSLAAALEGDYSKMAHADLVLTCQMLHNGRAAWRKEAEEAQSNLDTLQRRAEEAVNNYETSQVECHRLQKQIAEKDGKLKQLNACRNRMANSFSETGMAFANKLNPDEAAKRFWKADKDFGDAMQSVSKCSEFVHKSEVEKVQNELKDWQNGANAEAHAHDECRKERDGYREMADSQFNTAEKLRHELTTLKQKLKDHGL